jgi:predicted Fe-Mo cluster-binding NifX family protein
VAVKIAIPVEGERLCGHFGQCTRFAFFDVDPSSGQIVARNDLPAPEHQPGVLPQWLSEQGTSVVIAGGIGARACDLLEANQVIVISGAPEDDPRALVTSYLGGGLSPDANSCTNHDHTCTH